MKNTERLRNKSNDEICRTKEDFFEKKMIYGRDMSMQGIKITFERRGNIIICPETGKSWEILDNATGRTATQKDQRLGLAKP